ncbi:MAG: deoxyguanosinetriphosphate triphosphohydrolase [Planctomycetota bacterium]
MTRKPARRPPSPADAPTPSRAAGLASRDPGSPLASLSRAAIEEREARELAPFAMKVSASLGRQHDEPAHPFRTAYMRDRDRVIHAAAFRRLEYKTQVFVNHEGDSYRTRLTHTMEVAQVARTLARALRLNEDLTEAIALSHDIGHGPFGHAGESALADLMKDHGGFEHNAHGLRNVDVLERRYASFRGLNLTYEVREAFAMHAPGDKRALGFERCRPLLEAQLVDVCDNLTYTSHDLDDGIAAGCITPEEMREAELWGATWDGVVAEHADLPRPLQVSTAVKRVLDACVSDLLAATAARIAASGVDSPAAVRAHPHLLVGYSDAFGRAQRALARRLHERFYRHPRLVRMAQKGRRFLREIFEAYTSDPATLERPWKAWADEVGVPRAVCDHLASMTDRQALEEYRRLFLPYERA